MEIIKIEGMLMEYGQNGFCIFLIEIKQITQFQLLVDDVPFGYDCVICRERYPTRSERNEHLETHFVHKKCTDCDRLVILIGDLEFELHRPTHCLQQASQSIDYKDLQPFIAIERLKDVVPVADEREQENIETVEFDDKSSYKLTKKEEVDSDDCPLSIIGECLPKEETKPPKTFKPIMRKRNRKKPVKKSEDESVDKKTNRIQKTRTTKILTCTQEGCTEEFRQQLLLRKHLKTVHGVFEKHLCSICNFAFADRSNLKHHMVTHTDDKRFICSFCGARFHKLTNMTEHMNAHLGLKPYKCEICNKDFGRANHKRQHMRVNKNTKKNTKNIYVPFEINFF